MRDTSVRQSVRIASDRAIVGYRRIGCAFPFSRKEGRIFFSRMGRSWKKIRAPSKKLFSTRMAPPKGRPGKQSREIGPRDFHDIPLVFVRATAVEIISNEITNRNNAIEKLEKKSFSFFFFFFVSEKWSVALARWQMIPNELNDHEKRSIDFVEIEGGGRGEILVTHRSLR